MRPVAILSAMDQEISTIESRLADPTEHNVLGQRFGTGRLRGVDVVTAITGYGKVGAAATAMAALLRFDAQSIIFAGVAGSIHPSIEIGDIVIADRLVQHDYDTSPIFEPYIIPSLGVAEIPTNVALTTALVTAAERYLRDRSGIEITEVPDQLFAVAEMRLHRGLVASGDRFVSSLAEARSLLGQLPDTLAVEMEGAAVAQVCAERNVPFAVFRLISDRADHDAEVDFISFVSSVAAPLAAGIIEEYLTELAAGTALG